MNIITIIILIFSILGALDKVLGNRFGLGKEFVRGFELFAPTALSMIGLIIIAPAVGVWMKPLFDGFYALFSIDPSVIPALVLANDMGGASLAVEVAKNSVVGGFNAYVVSSMMGCIISFTIPFASGVVPPDRHREMFYGFLWGIVTIPVGCFVAGLLCGLTLMQILVTLLPLLIIAIVIAVGLVLIPGLCVKIFRVFGAFMQIVAMVGLALGIFTFLTGKTICADFDTFEEGARICANACVTLSGAFPLMYVVGKFLGKPITAFGNKLGINTTSALGFITTPVTNTTTFGMMRDMDKKGIVLNAALTVSASGAFGGHLAFTMSMDGSYVVPVIVGKLISGVAALVLALVVYKDKTLE